MNPNKKEKTILKAALKAARLLSKAQRDSIKDPTKLCDCCMEQFSWTTLEGDRLCDICYREKYGKTKME